MSREAESIFVAGAYMTIFAFLGIIVLTAIYLGIYKGLGLILSIIGLFGLLLMWVAIRK